MREHNERIAPPRPYHPSPHALGSAARRAFNVTHSPVMLVAIDGSRSAAEALRTTVQVARGSDWRMVVCHVVVPMNSTFDGPASMKRAREAALREGERVLAEARVVLGNVAAEFELLEGDPPDAICRRAEELACDLVVVGSRGLRLFERLLTRSVSSAVVGHAPCSVLVAPTSARAGR
jgi:nucleotide-binding universal stress UspA family protein